MKMLYPKILTFCLVLLVIYYNLEPDGLSVFGKSSDDQYVLVVERGAFHNDTFILTPDKIIFNPESNSGHGSTKYNTYSETNLNSKTILGFFTGIQDKGFWKLKDQYKSSSSCLSELKITLEMNGQVKTVICDDYERNCPDLIKYIDEKVVELEGNDLKRIYLPG